MEWKRVFFCLMLGPALLFSASEDWPCVNGNHYQTANNDEIVPVEAKARWFFSAAANIYYPVPVGDRILFSSLDQKVYCLDAKSGRPLWTFSSGAPLIRSLVVREKSVIVPAGSVIRNINLGSGELRWARDEQPNNIYVYPVISGDKVIYGTRKSMICRDLSTGGLVWQNNGINIFGGSVSVSGQVVVVQSRHYTEKRYTVSALDLRNGQLLWENPISPDFTIYTPVIYAGNVHVVSGNMLYCMDLRTGRNLWTKLMTGKALSECVFANGKLHLAMEGGFILVMDPLSGDTVSTVMFKPGKLVFGIVGENMFVLEHSSGSVFKVQLDTLEKTLFWRNKEGLPGGHQFAMADGTLYLPRESTLGAIGEYVGSSGLLASSGDSELRGHVVDEFGQPLKASVYIPERGKKLETSDQGDFSLPVRDSDFPLRLDLFAEEKMYRSVMVSNRQQDVRIALAAPAKDGSFQLDNIYFDFDRTDLKKEAIPVLLNVRDFLQANETIKMEIRGHTDNEGEEEYNLGLSQRRAERVRQFLVKNGVAEGRLDTRGMGESVPLVPNDNDEARAKNRRIEFVVR